MLFTNGTGTGKTFTGLGVVKRRAMQGKTNQLIVVPDNKIAADWIDSGKALGLDITQLESTSTAGKGIVITTYANLGANDELAKRQWDHVLPDEAHSLMQSEDGRLTSYLHNLRAITYHPDGEHQAWIMRNRPQHDELASLSANIAGNNRIISSPDTMDAMVADLRAKNAVMQARANAISKDLGAKREAIAQEWAANQKDARTRATFLSATPFAYHTSLEWGQGYLFDYAENYPYQGQSRAYNQPDPRQHFFMTHLGYRMAYNKLTKPDTSKIDIGMLERQVNSFLKKKGSLSGRMLEVEPDYDRRFVSIDSAVGNKIDEALSYLREQSNAEHQANRNLPPDTPYAHAWGALDSAIRNSFDHLTRRFLLEAIKAREAVPIVKQHLALGRRVVVFHDYKTGSGRNPFDIEASKAPEPGLDQYQGGDVGAANLASDTAKANAFNAARLQFRQQFPELFRELTQLEPPLDTFRKAFTEGKDLLVINGDERPRDVLARYKALQNDAGGPLVVLVQSDKNKGWSGHDTTGKFQRALINLGLPTAPTKLIQLEGRIYRTGVVSDAIMRSLNTGTNWERWAFAQTIASRASTAENLGMGELSRALRDSIIASFENADRFPPGHEGEGKGGKAMDRASNNVLSEFDRAKTYYWATGKKNQRTKAQEGKDYFATPEPLGLKMVQWADIRGGEDALEPSAGHGAIARWIPDLSNRTVIEPSPLLSARLAMSMNPEKDRIIEGTFEDHNTAANKYDAVVMNPPFGVGGKQALEHVAKAAEHLRPGGRIVALVPAGPAADKRLEQFLHGQDTRPAQPLGSTSRTGQYFAGDTVTLDSRAGQYVILGSGDQGVELRQVGAAPGITLFHRSHYIASIVKPGPRTEQFSPSEGLQLVADIALPASTFERAGTQVASHVIVLEKTDADIGSTRKIDLTSAGDINALFDRIEDLSVRPRAKPVEEVAQQQDAVRPGAAPAAPGAAAAPAPTGERGTEPLVEHVTQRGKTLRGVVRMGISKAEAQAIDPFTFKKDGGWFIREQHLKPPAATSMSERSVPLPLGERATAAEVHEVAEQVLKAFAHQPPVLIRDSAIGVLPGAVEGIAGAVHGGRIYLFRDQLESKAAVARTLFHELLHYGLRRFLSREDYISELTALGKRDAFLNQQASRWVRGEDGQRAQAFAGPEYAFARGVDEALAILAEPARGEYLRTDSFNRTIRAVQRWLAALAERIGWKDLAADIRGKKNEEARQYIQSVFGRLEEGAPASEQAGDFADPAFATREPAADGTRPADLSFAEVREKVAEQLGMPVAQAQSIVNDLTKDWKGGIEVRVVPTARDLPGRDIGSGKTAARGVYANGVGYIVASMHKDREAIGRTLAHEVIQHHGLRATLGPDGWQRLMKQIQAAARAGNQDVLAAQAYVRRVYVNAEGAPRLREGGSIEADEIGAHLIEQSVDADGNMRPSLQWMKWVWAKVADFLRTAGLKVPFTLSELQGIWVEARRGLEQARTATSHADTVIAPREGEGAGALYALSDEQIVGNTGRDYSQAQERAMRNVGWVKDPVPLKERMQHLWANLGKTMTQGLVDQFAPIKDLSREAYGLLRLSKGASGAFEVMLQGGQLKLTDGAYDFDESKRGGVVKRLLIPLQGEHHDFLRWVAANRAEQLLSEDRERLFTGEDIRALKTLSEGELGFEFSLQHGPRAGQTTTSRAEAYTDSLATFNEFNKNTLDMAQESGLIDGESRGLWEKQFYVPFYRVADGDDGGVRGMNIKSGVVRQQAFKQLKGGTQHLNADLLENTLMNWAHLLDASAKNRAARATLQVLSDLGSAIESRETDVRSMASSINKRGNVVWMMDGGRKRFFLVDDPHLLAAVSALEFAGFRSPVMRAMSAFKHALTSGVTASPFFKVRNLLRDSLQSIASAPLSANPAQNIRQGWALTKPGTDSYYQLLAGGGTIHFGSMMEGSEARRVQALVDSGIDRATILDTGERVQAMYRKTIQPLMHAYTALGDRGEAVNRAALYQQLRDQGVPHADAALQARDLMDFSMQGSFTTVRFLTQVVPFMNARMQGLYKLGRAAKEDPARFSAVLGAVSLMSIALLAAYGDDDDWKKREDWDRNNYWWFKAGGMAYRIPKPFEIGAIATLAERSWEAMFDREMTGERFRQQVVALMGDQLSMNPLPQMVKPVLDVYANKDSFTGRPIETMGMEKLQPEYRFRGDTTMAARGASTVLNAAARPLGADAPSPVQIDHMVRGYMGWLGSMVVSAGDTIARPLTGQPSQPQPDYWRALTGSMVSTLEDAPSRYVSTTYTQAKQLEEIYGTWRNLIREGKMPEAQAFREEYSQELVRYRQVEAVKRVETRLNQLRHQVEEGNGTPEEKRMRMREINDQSDRVARRLAPTGP